MLRRARRWLPFAERRDPLLAGERVALNFLQHLSGIATYARRLKEELAGTRAEFLDTRKTTPGLRTLQKYAVRMGGGRNHRLRLDDGILIKGNHLRLVGGVRTAVERALQQRPAGYHVEVEITSLEELDQAILAGADGVLLDNMTPAEVRECVERAAGASAWRSPAASTPAIFALTRRPA
jgi:nicotinate-nucleotide pyrophosphorylase (carboxylating)